VTGRISGELAFKAARARISTVATPSIPSTIAVDIAKAARMVLIGRAVSGHPNCIGNREAGTGTERGNRTGNGRTDERDRHGCGARGWALHSLCRRPKGLELVHGVRIIDRVRAALEPVVDDLLLIANDDAAGAWLPA
jgi:hypothetical protein